MNSGIAAKISSLAHHIAQAIKGEEAYASQPYTSELITTCHSELRTSWMEAAQAHRSYGPDSFYVFKLQKSEIRVNSAAPIILITYDKDFSRNLDGTLAVYTKAAALNILKDFEETMERRCLREKTAGDVNYSKAAPELPSNRLYDTPAISMF